MVCVYIYIYKAQSHGCNIRLNDLTCEIIHQYGKKTRCGFSYQMA